MAGGGSGRGGGVGEGGLLMRLIEHWGTVLRRSAVTWVTVVLTFLVGALTPAYMAIFAFLGFVPSPFIQIVVGGLVVTIVVGGPIILARLVEQPKLAAKLEAKAEEKRDAV